IKDLKFGNKLGAKIAHQPALYYPIEQAYPEIKTKAYDLTKLEAANNITEIDKHTSLYPNVAGWLPLWGQQQHMVVFIDEKGKPLKIVNLRPWTEEQMNTVLTSTL
ncbi:hypothetical protein ACS8FD_23325, partial [Psychrobacter sp. 1U2]